ncbi:nuclear transport factor 2 family protein [Gordonia sp. NPDC127522]|uniref:nuclear transport factor 2 family protein n=1 Tax=Gordonia sp. NPDC127522 TaxID=3345390 RepID=UPI00362C0ECE
MAPADHPATPQSDCVECCAIHEIQRLFAQRLQVMDMRQWDRYGSLHTEDVVSESWGELPDDKQPTTGGTAGRVVGREALAATIRKTLDGPVRITTVHHGHTPQIELTSTTTATGLWAMEDHLWWTDGDEEHHLHGYGHYHEEYRRVDGEWLFSYRRLSRLRVDQSPGFFRFMTGG